MSKKQGEQQLTPEAQAVLEVMMRQSAEAVAAAGGGADEEGITEAERQQHAFWDTQVCW